MVLEQTVDPLHLGRREVGEEQADHVLLLPRVQAGDQQRASCPQHGAVGAQTVAKHNSGKKEPTVDVGTILV